MAQSPRKPTVVVADDHLGNLERVCETLSTDFEVLAQVQDGLTAFHAAIELQPDILILDFSMPKMDGIQTARELRKRNFRSAILFLTIHADASEATRGNLETVAGRARGPGRDAYRVEAER